MCLCASLSAYMIAARLPSLVLEIYPPDRACFFFMGLQFFCFFSVFCFRFYFFNCFLRAACRCYYGGICAYVCVPLRLSAWLLLACMSSCVRDIHLIAHCVVFCFLFLFFLFLFPFLFFSNCFARRMQVLLSWLL